MYQRILNLLNIRGYQKQMTPLGPCYIKEEMGRKKGVFMTYEHKPDGTMYTQEEASLLDEKLKRYIGPNASVLVLILSDKGRSTWTDPDRAFEELYDPVCLILSAAGKDEEQSDTHPEGSVSENWENIRLQRLFWLLIFLCICGHWPAKRSLTGERSHGCTHSSRESFTALLPATFCTTDLIICLTT